MLRRFMLVSAVALAAISTAAVAAVTFDAGSGTGFVGKGDVQLALGLNNAQVQNATLSFSYDATTITEVEWTCSRNAGEQTQERSRTTTSSSQGIVASAARVKNQITGYNLTGYGAGSTSSSTSNGPALGSCPTFWTNTSGVSDPTVVSSTGELSVNGVAL